MHPRIFYRDRLIDAAKARLPAVSALTFYGRGVFTTLAIYDGRPFLWPAHWRRLAAHAARAGLSLGDLTEESVGSALARLIEANGVKTGRARLSLSAPTLSGPWAAPSESAAGDNIADLLICTGEARPPHADAEGLSLTVSPYRVNTHSPLAGVKSVNYLDHLLAWEEARARQFDEAVVLNERGEIASATMANLFWVHDGTLHTPALATGCLAGTTRHCVADLAASLSIPLVEGVYDLSRLGDADEIFLTSTGLGVAIVTTFDFHRYTVHVGSVAAQLREAYRQLTLHR